MRLLEEVTYLQDRLKDFQQSLVVGLMRQHVDLKNLMCCLKRMSYSRMVCMHPN